MKNVFSKVILSGTLVLLTSGALVSLPKAFANDGFGHGDKAKFEQHQEEMLNSLGLTDDQKTKIKAIKEQGRANNKALHEQVRNRRKALMDYVKSPNATESQAKVMNAEIGGLMAKLNEQRLNALFQMKTVLTAEQFDKMLSRPRDPGFKGHKAPERGSQPN